MLVVDSFSMAGKADLDAPSSSWSSNVTFNICLILSDWRCEEGLTRGTTMNRRYIQCICGCEIETQAKTEDKLPRRWKADEGLKGYQRRHRIVKNENITSIVRT